MQTFEMALNTAARVWGPYKELHHIVESSIQRKQPDVAQDLEVALRKHKPDFITLLQNQAKNATHRSVVMKADREGLPVQGQQGSQLLTQQFIQEALTLSDLFDLNEYAAVELLMTGESQRPFFPGLKRGLVAVLLYYDGRASLVSALRALIQCRRGRTWSLGLPDDLVDTVMTFTGQLMAEELTKKILVLLKAMDTTAEVQKLQAPNYRALGPAKHKRQVTEKISEVQSTLADCLFCWACQSPLSKRDALLLVSHLRESRDEGGDGALSDGTLALLMALLYTVDPRSPGGEDARNDLPLFSDPTFVPDLHADLTSPRPWASTGVKAVVNFVWAITLRNLSQYPDLQGVSECCERDEFLIDQAVEDNVFSFLRNAVLANPKFHSEEYYVRQMHNILTDFIVQMPLKMKELRNRGDETSRIILANQQEGLEPPPGLRRDFEQLLYLIGDLYMKDSPDRELALEFWCPPEAGLTPGTSLHSTGYTYRPPQRQISLYKFVRLAGDLLSPPLFIPYIHMLRGLANGPQCAHHCFNLLHSNGAGGGQGSTISWDHFFASLNQYYTNLRQEAPPVSDMAHIYRHHPRGITVQEVDGLTAVLRLLRQVAFWDERARISLCENQHWLPLVVLLGLVTCNVPATLKSELLRSLAALCKSPDIAASFWQSLEVSQIIPTFSASGIHAKGGLLVELDEVEARDEEFPMTRAFLDLLTTLTDNPIPAGLGAGYRAPGFRPYLDFLRDSVFLKFNTRAYRDPAEKWQVGSAVLEILHKILAEYVVMVDDFVPQPVEVHGEGMTVANKPPGFTLMEHLLNDSPMLKMVLFVLDEATRLLDKHISFPGKPELERASLWCLRLVETVCQKQEAFLDALRESGGPVIVASMDKLLTGINARTGKADHLVNVTKYVTYNSWLPDHALSAVRILSTVSPDSLVQPKVVGLFTASERVAQSLLHGFVECLENPEEPEEEEEPSAIISTDEDASVGTVRNATRQEIVRLLLRTLHQPAPNLAHFLLGFEIRKPVSKTNLQDPGVLDCPRTCLHAVLSLLNAGVGPGAGVGAPPTCSVLTPRLAELSYQLVYTLCADLDTSGPTMRYLRTHDFLYQHLQHLPFTNTAANEGSSSATERHLLTQQSWLLRTAAIELRLTSANRQRSHTQRLLNLLLDDTPTVHDKGVQPDGAYNSEYSQYDLEYSMFTSSQIQYHQAMAGGQARRKLLTVLDAIALSQPPPPPLALEFFNPGLLQQVAASCEARDDLGVTLTDVRQLHRILTTELHGSGTGQRALIQQEITEICANMAARNGYRSTLHAKRQTFDAWRHTVEIILTACPEDLLQGEPRQSVIFELIQDLLAKVSAEDALPELTAPVSGVILTLLANLRHCFLSEPLEGSTGPVTAATQYVTMLDGAHASVSGHMTYGGAASGARTLFASSLQVVLRGLIEHMMRSSSGSQRVRAYLYGALLYYLQIAQKPRSVLLETDAVSGGGVGAKMTSKETEYERLTRENMETITSYGDGFMEVVCRDACDGHDIGRTLSLATLDLILCLDKSGAWLGHLNAKGYLQHIVDSLLEDDARLRDMLQQQPEPLKALYIFESKVGLLTRIAETVVGAHTLLQCGLTTKLAECSILDFRPEIERDSADFVPAMISRYRQQILFPILKMCLAILTSLGIDNRQASQNVVKLIIAHSDLFSAILRDRHTTLHLEALQELALTTAVIGRAALDESLEEMPVPDSTSLEYRGILSRIQRQMLALLPRYCHTERLHKQLAAMATAGDSESALTDTREQAQLAVEEIASNVVAFCRAIVAKSGTSSQMFKILFGPSLMEATGRDFRMVEDLQTSMINSSRPQNLGIIVYMLQQGTQQFLSTYDSHKHHLRKYNNVPNLSVDELKEFCSVANQDKLSSQQRQRLARRRLQIVVARKTRELQIFSYIIENCLFILWRHLEFYLIHCVAADESASALKLRPSKQHSMRRLDSPSSTSFSEPEEPSDDPSVTLGVTRDDLDQLKREALLAVNETLLRRLLEIEQCYTKNRTRYGFVEALIRRIKRLLKLHTGPS